MADEQHSLATYVSDMLALERHIEKPFHTQMDDGDFNDYTNAKALVIRLDQMAHRHCDALERALDRLGGHEASPIKSAVTGFEGLVAGAIDKMRKTKVSKALRDDYTALALCTAGYTMLLSTANGLGDTMVAQLAEQHLRDYAGMVMDIGQALPQVVLQELRDTGLTVDTTTATQSQQIARQAWQSQSDDGASVEERITGTTTSTF